MKSDKEWIKWIKENDPKPKGIGMKNWIKSHAYFISKEEFDAEVENGTY